MLFYFLAAAATAVAVWGLVRQARHGLHMLQLNGYKNKEHLVWMKNDPGLLLPNLLLAVYSVFFVFFGNTALYVIFILLSLPILPVNRKRFLVKKPLVVTARVKRMITTICALSLISVAPWVFIRRQNHYFLALGLFEAAFVFYPLLSNIVNRPIEKHIADGFIKSAKQKLASVPGLQVIGITGSFGKTSVKFYLYAIMSAFYDTLVTPESFNTPMGVVKTVNDSLKNSDRFFLCEMGARHVGDIKELTDIVHPRHGVITAIGEQHLETFGSVDNIIRTKYDLARALPDDGLLFLNGESENIMNNLPDRPYITYGLSDKLDYYADGISVTAEGMKFTAHRKRDGASETFTTALLGEHNIINLMGAIACANSFGIGLKDMRIPIRRIKPVKHRMEMIDRGDMTIIDDAYNSNPAGCRAALRTLSGCEGLKILVTPGMVELGEKQYELNREFGAEAARRCDYIVLVGEKQTEPIADGVRSGDFDEKRLFIASGLNEAMNFVGAIKSDRRKFVLLENDLPDNYK